MEAVIKCVIKEKNEKLKPKKDNYGGGAKLRNNTTGQRLCETLKVTHNRKENYFLKEIGTRFKMVPANALIPFLILT
jgi:hypothetical protein